MLIHLLPLSAPGYCCLETNEIFLSWQRPYIIDTFKHELAHLLAKTSKHNSSWLKTFLDLKPQFYNFVDITPIGGIYAANIGNISGIQNILTDYYLLQAYRRSSQQILGTIGHWEVLNEGGDGPTKQLIRLYPTPKGAFPVTVLYYPTITHFRSPQARMLASEMLLAETKIMVGAARRKIAGIPMPDGGSLALDGEAMANEGREEKKEIIERAIHLSEPLPIIKAG